MILNAMSATAVVHLRQLLRLRAFSKHSRTMSSLPWKDDKVTHNGQVFEEKDFRMARFLEGPKLVNPNFAEVLINEVPPIEVESRVVSCDGGGGALGHPKIFVNVDKPGNHACGYCGLRFVLKGHHGSH